MNCNTTLNFGCIGHCDRISIDVDTDEEQYELWLESNHGKTRKILASENGSLTIEMKDLNENMYYEAQIYKDGSLIEVQGHESFSFKTEIVIQ